MLSRVCAPNVARGSDQNSFYYDMNKSKKTEPYSAKSGGHCCKHQGSCHGCAGDCTYVSSPRPNLSSLRSVLRPNPAHSPPNTNVNTKITSTLKPTDMTVAACRRRTGHPWSPSRAALATASSSASYPRLTTTRLFLKIEALGLLVGRGSEQCLRPRLWMECARV